MSANEASADKELSAAVVTEAAAWVARLHGPNRTLAVEKGFRSWLAESAEHGRAFELVTESWDEVATLKSGADIDITLRGDKAPSKRPLRSKLVPVALAAAIALVVVAGVIDRRNGEGVVTRVGEQRVLTLDDGSRVHLNTATHLTVDYDEQTRRVTLDAGEAFFEVARHPNRPFVVAAGDREVTALGTSFIVRREDRQTAVTLVEGKVAVASIAKAGGRPNAPAILTPGERLTFDDRQVSPRLDHPSIEKLTAWQQGKVPIDDLSLAEAITEMNRYGAVPLALERPEAAHLRVSGIFRAGDSLSFAKAVSRNYGLRVEEEPRRIVLSGLPQRAP